MELTDQQKQAKVAKERLQAILNDIEAFTKVLNSPLDGWDASTRAGAVIRQREAEDQVKSLTEAYRTLISNSVIKVFLTGPRAESFAVRAGKEGAVVVDGHSLYKEFAAQVRPSLDEKNPQFMSAQLILLTQVMQRYMQGHGIHTLQMPKLDSMDMDLTLRSDAEVENIVQKAVRNSNGDDLLAFDLTNRILTKALEVKAATTAMPCILTGLTADEQQSLSVKLFGRSTPTISLEATEQSTDEDLIQELNEKILKVYNKK